MDRREIAPPAPPRFVLLTPADSGMEEFPALLAACCRSADVAAVICRTGAKGRDQSLALARRLMPAAHAAGAAFLLENHGDLVLKAGADGAHLTSPEMLQSALPLLKPGKIAGAAGLATRHDAMTAGEAGADYVMFGEPVAGKRPVFAAVVERVEWWTEIFEIPCTAFAASLDEIPPLARARAEFIALADAIWNAPEGALAALITAAASLQAGQAA